MTAPVPAATDEQPLDPQETAAPESAAAPIPALPDRADAPVSEVVERFLRAVVAEVPLELIEELHLFSPLRQGTVETGIAVLAARVPVAEAVEQAEDMELPFAADVVESEETVEADEVEALTAEAPTAEALTAEAPEAESDVAADAALDAELNAALVADAGEEPLGDGAIVLEGEGVTEVRDVVAAEGDDDEDVAVNDDVMVEASADESDEAEAVSEPTGEPIEVVKTRPVRHTVYTARYRYVIKGPERGKWESNIKAEADAPLITVETVVRGVQRRAGEESEIVRYTGAQIARALRVPYSA